MIQQVEITLPQKSRGFHLVTGEIMRQLSKLPKTGIISKAFTSVSIATTVEPENW